MSSGDASAAEVPGTGSLAHGSTLRAPTASPPVDDRAITAGADPTEPPAESARPVRGPRRVRNRLRNSLRRVPSAAWICALVAIVNAVCWSIVVPPFQTPDEPSHYAYAAHLAETGQLPSSVGEDFPPAEQVALNDVLQDQVRFSQENHTIATQAEQEHLESGLTLLVSRSEPGAAGLAAGQPPLYYALETIPYYLGWSGTVLDRLALMRLLSALMGGATALFAFCFVREVLPRERWAWTVGGLGVALAPLLGMMSGAVNPDALLFAVSTALFFLLARGFRRGLTRSLAIGIGVALLVGCFTKLTFLGLVPGAVLGLLVLAVRAARARSSRSPYGWLVIALGIAAVPAGIYFALQTSSAPHPGEVLSGAVGLAGRQKSIPDAISHIWQLYLPRLPGMSPAYHGMSGASFLWWEGIVGKYGWLDTDFPRWVVKVALIPAALLALLLARALLVSRAALRSRPLEICVYAVMALGILGVIGVDEYIHDTPGEYIQLRYALPLIALLGVGLALAARGAGRRWGPAAGALIVVLLLAHDLFSQLLTISRYYG
jgi:Predicted membrane protein (DUF2142)